MPLTDWWSGRARAGREQSAFTSGRLLEDEVPVRAHAAAAVEQDERLTLPRISKCISIPLTDSDA